MGITHQRKKCIYFIGHLNSRNNMLNQSVKLEEHRTVSKALYRNRRNKENFLGLFSCDHRPE